MKRVGTRNVFFFYLALCLYDQSHMGARCMLAIAKFLCKTFLCKHYLCSWCKIPVMGGKHSLRSWCKIPVMGGSGNCPVTINFGFERWVYRIQTMNWKHLIGAIDFGNASFNNFSYGDWDVDLGDASTRGYRCICGRLFSAFYFIN